MKHSALSILALSVLLAASACGPGNETPPSPDPGGGGGGGGQEAQTPLTFRAVLQPLSGAGGTVDPPLTLQWHVGDRIAVFCGREGGTNSYPYVSAQGDGVFTGSGNKTSRYWSVYPASMVQQFSPGKTESVPDTLYLHFPCEQKGYAGRYDPDAWGAVCTSADTTLSFRNVGALVRFSLSGSASIRQATLRTPDGARFGGIARVTISADNKPAISTYVDRKSAFSVWLKPVTSNAFENGTPYCFSVPAQAFPQGLKIIFTNAEGKEAIWSDATPRDIAASSLLDLGTIDTDRLTWEDVAVVEFLKESGKSLLWPFSNPATNPFPTGYKDTRQVNFMRTRIPMTLDGFGDFVIYVDYDTNAYAEPSAALGKCYVAPTNHTGFRYGSSPGSYLEIPGREGKAAYKITITAGTNGEFSSNGSVTTSNLGELKVTDAKGNDIPGGEVSKAKLTKGSELTWRFAGTNGMPYRIVSTGSSETDILELRAYYMSASDPLDFSAESVRMGRISVDPASFSSAVLRGSFEALPFFDASRFRCGFELRETGAPEWTRVFCAEAAEQFSHTVTGLTPRRDYECRAIVQVGEELFRSEALPFNTTFLEEAEDDASDVKASYDYAVLKAMGHPRLLMRQGDFETLAERVGDRATWPTLAQLNDLILSYAEGEVASQEAITYTLDASNKRLLSVSRKVEKRLMYCAYAFRMTGRTDFLDKVVETLRIVCAQFPDWHPSHYLDVGEMALGVAIAYDWLYYDLDYDTRVMVRKALSDYAVDTALHNSSGKSATQNTRNNWNSVCNGGLVAAAIAAYPQDKARCAQVIENALPSNTAAVQAMYAPDGNYGEGYGYWEYGTTYQICLLQMLQKAFGHDSGLSQVEGFLKTGGFMLFMGTPCGGNFSFADGGSSGETMQIPMWWFAVKTGNSSLLANEIRLLNKGKYSANRLLPVIPGIIMDFHFDPSNLAFPSSNLWVGEGLVPVAMIHTGWHFDATDCYVGLKGGAANANHGHMDAGSFVFESQGVRWSDDLKRPDYAGIENLTAAAGGSYWTMTQSSLRWDIFRMNNLSHSTLSFSNFDKSFTKRYATDHNVSGKATLVEKYTDSASPGVKMDLTPVYKGQAQSVYRTIRLEGDKLVITDEVTATAKADAQMMWRMLTSATVESSGAGQTLSKDGKRLSLSATASSPSVTVSYKTWAAARPSDWTARPAGWDDANEGYVIAGYTATVPAGTTVTFTTTLGRP